MSKARIFLTVKVIFLSIIGIFAINSVKVHGEISLEVLNRRNEFIGKLYDAKEQKVFIRLYDYIDTTRNLSRRFKLLVSIKEEFTKMNYKRNTGYMRIVSKRVFKYALGEALSRVIPVFKISDRDALTLVSIYLNIALKDLNKMAEEVGAQYIGCRSFNYSSYESLVNKSTGRTRFYFYR